MKKKVLFIIWSFTFGGGAERILANIVNNLSPDKYDIDVIEFAHFDIKREPVRDDVKILEPVIKYKSKEELKKLGFAAAFRQKFISVLYNRLVYDAPWFLRRKFIKDKYDIEVSFNYLKPSFLVSDNPSSRKFVWMHGSIEDLDYRSMENPSERSQSLNKYRLQKRTIYKFERIITISNKTYNSVVRVFPEVQDKLMKIYNGFDFDNIISRSREVVQVENEENLIVGAGRLDKGKNFKLLVDAAGLLKSEGINFNILILGEGEERPALEAQIRGLGLEDKVKLLGFKDNPYPYMKKARAFCLSSLGEGFPTVIAEAMTLGCPFVSTNVAGIEELSEGGKCGLVVDYDEKSMAKALKRILTEEALRDELGRNCLERVQEFTLRNQIDKIEKLFDETN